MHVLTGKYDVSVRVDSRAPTELRPITITPGFIEAADGSALVAVGGTRLICTASVDKAVPAWMKGRGSGWITAEYGMLPASTGDRRSRDISRGKLDGRSSEIQRLIGRSLRASVDLEALGERSVWVDCDVIQADGGTRCAAILGGAVALELALQKLAAAGELGAVPIVSRVAAVSVGVVDGAPFLDLCYEEDARADVDMNVVMTADGRLVEVQSTAEGGTFSASDLGDLVALALGALPGLCAAQAAALIA